MINWPTDLIDDIARRRCIIYLGSGISMNSTNDKGEHPKSWSNLLEKGMDLLKESDQGIKKCIKKYLDKEDYLMGFELLKCSLSRDVFVNFLKNEFIVPHFDHSPIHEDIFSLDTRIIITTNIDKIYDTYANSLSNGTINIKNYYDEDLADCIRNSEHLIFKIHGCITTPDKAIFSSIDYASIRNTYKDFYLLLESLIMNHTFLFLGAGLNDPDIRLLFENYRFKYKYSKSHHFVIPKNKYIPAELKIFSELLNMNFIQYDAAKHHKELIYSVKNLVNLVDEKRRKLAETMSW